MTLVPKARYSAPIKGARMNESNVKFTRDEALEFHSRGRPGKIEIVATKPMATQRDLSLAYSRIAWLRAIVGWVTP